jgi:hypothetical protein
VSIGISLPQLPTARKPIPKTENSDFVFLPRTHQLGQPNMEGLIPIVMAVAWMTLLASSTSPSLVVSSFKLLNDPHGLPFFSKVIHPSLMSFSRVERRLIMVGRAGLSSRSHSLLSDLNTQSSLILRSHKHVRLSVGRADLSSQSPVVLCRSPLLLTSLAVPLKLSQGPGHSSRHRPAATVRPRSGSHQTPQPAQQTHRTRAERKAHSRGAQCPSFEA